MLISAGGLRHHLLCFSRIPPAKLLKPLAEALEVPLRTTGIDADPGF
jgi:hypothetical protein